MLFEQTFVNSHHRSKDDPVTGYPVSSPNIIATNPDQVSQKYVFLNMEIAVHLTFRRDDAT